jgi:hypothetical protein
MERGPPLFSISCEPRSKVLHFDRHAGAPANGKATLSLTSALRAASLSARPAGQPGSEHWRASLPGSELPKSVFELLDGLEPIRITVADTRPVLAPPGEIVTNVLRSCGFSSGSNSPRERAAADTGRGL